MPAAAKMSVAAPFHSIEIGTRIPYVKHIKYTKYTIHIIEEITQ